MSLTTENPKKNNIKDNLPVGLTIIDRENPLYHYARVISNTRFGHMPTSIAYCKSVAHVSYCINFCRNENVPFRIRSGGHQHEGMSSGNGVIIIDLSEMNEIEYDKDIENVAWIPVGKQLGKVYEELEKRHQILPGGGCQSVNVGGLTQGGGWGMSIRKYGLTCDSVLACEIVLADGTVAILSDEDEDKDIRDLFKAIKGGGGGNFGVVTRFRFRLASLLPVTTSIALRWENGEKVKSVMKTWTKLHADMTLDPALSTACGMLVAKPENGEKGTVHLRMGGFYYGSKKKLLLLLIKHFGDITSNIVSLKQTPETYNEDDEAGALQKRAAYKSVKQNIITSSMAAHQSFISDFVNPTAGIADLVENHGTKCGKRDLTILPDAPGSTCDKPHPHKITSGFPVNGVNHEVLVDAIYNYLADTCYHKDVNRYMSFHCLGGAVTENSETRIFAFHEKPYLLQPQAWWNDSGNLFTNEKRNKEYVAWIEDFRKHLSPHIEGAFINFVDRSLVKDIHKPENRLKLLEIYYGKENLDFLRKVKTKHDPTQVFNFEMSVLPE